jgi:hypothetical protein
MTDFQDRRIVKVTSAMHGFLFIEWQGGSQSFFDVRPYIVDGEAFEFLRDPDCFNTVRLGEDGRSVEWTDFDGDIVDFCVDTLWARRTPIKRMPARPSAPSAEQAERAHA